MTKFEFVVSRLSEEDVKFLWGAIVAYVEGAGGELTGEPSPIHKMTDDELTEYYKKEFENED
jgi:hypothetical protein